MHPPWPVRTLVRAARSTRETIAPFVLLSVSSYPGAVILSTFRRSTCVNRIPGATEGACDGRAETAGDPVETSESATSTPDPSARRLRPRITRQYTRSRTRRPVKRRHVASPPGALRAPGRLVVHTRLDGGPEAVGRFVRDALRRA